MDAIGKGSRASQCYGCLIAELYNARRPHRAHDGQTPDEIYFGTLTQLLAAA